MGAFFAPLSAKIFGGLSLALAIACGVLWLSLGAEKRHSEKLQTRLAQTEAAYAQFAADVKAKTAEAMKADLENKARVEAAQDQVTKEKENALRARRDLARANLLRAGATGTDSRGGGTADSARSADTSELPAGASAEAQLHVADDLICIDNTIKAEGWLEFWRAIEAIPR